MFNKLFGKDDGHEFKPILVEIEENPVSPLGRSIFWIIVCTIIFAVAWMILGKIDVVISSRGQIIPDGEIKVLQPLDTGVIDKILVKAGSFVKKGQVVMEINPSSIEPQLESSKKNLNYIQIEMDRLKATSNGGMFVLPPSPDFDTAKTQQEIYSSSMGSLDKQLATKQLELKKIEEQIGGTNVENDNYNTLLNTAVEKKNRLEPVLDIIPKDQYEQVKNDINTYQSRIESNNHKLAGLSQQKLQTLEEIDYIKENFKATNLKELSDRQKQANELVANIKETTYKSTKQKIVSPVDGYVNTLFIHTVGGVVSPAEKLLSIVPVNTPLIIKANVLNKDIGYVEPNMEVSIKVDTFEFQKYGILKGKVKTVSKTSIDDEKLGPIYEVYITPIDNSVVIDKKTRYITPGMSLTAEIKVQKRRVIEFFIYPLIKYWGEGISVR